MSQQSKPNAVRRAKMRTLTLSDEAWAELERRAGPGGSKSKVVETWLRAELETQWRVQVKSPGGQITHETTFNSLATAMNYYESLDVLGSTKSLQVRHPEKAQWREREEKRMGHS